MRKQLVPRPSNDPAVVFEAHELGHFMLDAAALLEELPMSKQDDPPEQWKIGEVLAHVPLHRNSIDRLLKLEQFPQPHRLHPGGVRFWYANEIRAWLDANTPRGPRSRPWNRKP
jgi:predicted DNA-binding transcriptional regulator AlpA